MAPDLLAPIPVPTPQAIASYPATDIAAATSQVLFYGAKDEDSYFLTTQQLYSNRVMTTVTHSSPGGVDTLSHDLDFDILFNAPQRIRGQVIVSVPFGVRNTVGTTQNFNRYVKIYVRKVTAAAVESTIASATGETHPTTGSYAVLTTAQHRVLLTTSVTVPLTDYKVGEKLRITVEAHGWNGGANADYFIGHDPQNRATDGWETTSTNTFNTDPSIMMALVPFVPAL